MRRGRGKRPPSKPSGSTNAIRLPGADAWFSGINTSTEALDAIKSGRLTALAGGHFITGAWAVVMIYDYHHGRDFADEGLELERAMFAEFTPLLADR